MSPYDAYLLMASVLVIIGALVTAFIYFVDYMAAREEKMSHGRSTKPRLG